ncbi:MAG: type II toxin-antitoxin system RelE/ParE family toxin [Candidatus Yonathbacteria bacterium]|nr:type II toxin-antitoxin system RelE/ParE family toxin [Candidatus Yonathbacteria bacterium]
MLWDYRLARRVFRNLKKFPKKEQERVFDVLEKMKEDPFLGDIVKIGGEDNVWRKRVGSYRIKYRLWADEKIIDIYDVERRTNSTY